MHRRMRRGGGAGGGSCPPKFGQTVGEIRANSGGNSGKARRKNGQRKLKDYQINNDGNPDRPPWNVDDVTQAMFRGGGVLANVQE